MIKSTRTLLLKIEKALFYAVTLSIPFNLGKHFVLESSYVYGKLLDYLIPTIFIQDILIFFLILVSLPKLLKFLTISIKYWEFALLTLFIASLILSICTAAFPIASWYFLIRLLLYMLFGFYIFSQVNILKELPTSLKIFSFLLLFQSILGLAQWLNQGSVFNNYLFFGEQPYSMTTPQIVRVPFGGVTRVPPYGTFRHPNVLAGFLSFCIVFILGLHPKKFYFYLPILPGIICLLLTSSRLGMLSCFLGISLLILPKKFIKPFSIFTLMSCLIFTIYMWVYPNLPAFFLVENFATDPSFYRRRNLFLIGWELFRGNPLYGIGLNNFMYYVDKISISLSLPKFTQPIHNVFLLFLVESGAFAFFLLISFFTLLLEKTFSHFQNPASGRYSRLFLVLFISFLPALFFDHFLLTSQQMLLVFCLTTALALQYNLK